MRHTELAGDLSGDHAAFKLVGCPHATCFHGLVITLTYNPSVRPPPVIVRYQNELTHTSVSHQTPALR
jgi:hypothetical protein